MSGKGDGWRKGTDFKKFRDGMDHIRKSMSRKERKELREAVRDIERGQYDKYKGAI